jgi:TetR/AcrR family transcriptional repressor of nem operon
MILAVAKATAQAHGYNGLSFRELAKTIGVKSASIHYHFPTKSDLGVALARRYWEDNKAKLEDLWTESKDPATCLRNYTAIFRKALETGNRMCMCGFMAAEYDDLPDAVKIEVQAFADINVAWLTKVLSSMNTPGNAKTRKRHARAIFAAIGGAQLMARSRADISLYDEIIESYHASGLIPC